MKTQFEWRVVGLEGAADSEKPVVVNLEGRLLKKKGELMLEVRQVGGVWYWVCTLAPYEGKLQLLRGAFSPGGKLGKYLHLVQPSGQIATSAERENG